MTIDGSKIDNESWLVQTCVYSALKSLPQTQKEAWGQMERMQPRPGNLGQESG